ncbi:MAG: GTPase Era [Comamonadaceae bacterium]|nr:GTPase Era [Comamonadaceae bacterium]
MRRPSRSNARWPCSAWPSAARAARAARPSRRRPGACSPRSRRTTGRAARCARDAPVSDAPVSDAPAPQRCGLVAIVGRPNVGKSTLLNALVGQKISITSKKAQTTRHRIAGIRTLGTAQFVFVDTPGFQTRQARALNRLLNRTVLAALADVDVVLFVCEAGRFGADDARVLALLPAGRPALLVANKLDALARRTDVLPWLQQMQERHAFAEFVPMSARRAADVERLLTVVAPYLPGQPWLHEQDALSDRSERFLAGEIVREKLFRLTGDELPYTSTVVIERFDEDAGGEPGQPGDAAPGRRIRIAAAIVVERDAHKGMIIGAGGERLKRIGTEARRELERLLGARVVLELWVKVRSGWADDETHLRSYGYE